MFTQGMNACDGAPTSYILLQYVMPSGKSAVNANALGMVATRSDVIIPQHRTPPQPQGIIMNIRNVLNMQGKPTKLECCKWGPSHVGSRALASQELPIPIDPKPWGSAHLWTQRQLIATSSSACATPRKYGRVSLGFEFGFGMTGMTWYTGLVCVLLYAVCRGSFTCNLVQIFQC